MSNSSLLVALVVINILTFLKDYFRYIQVINALLGVNERLFLDPRQGQLVHLVTYSVTKSHVKAFVIMNILLYRRLLPSAGAST